MPFEFKAQHDYDLHIALEVPYEMLQPMLDKGKKAGIESRGISDHGFIHSIYFRDPNGYVIELTARLPNHDEATNPASQRGAREARALAGGEDDQAELTLSDLAEARWGGGAPAHGSANQTPSWPRTDGAPASPTTSDGPTVSSAEGALQSVSDLRDEIDETAHPQGHARAHCEHGRPHARRDRRTGSHRGPALHQHMQRPRAPATAKGRIRRQGSSARAPANASS